MIDSQNLHGNDANKILTLTTIVFERISIIIPAIMRVRKTLQFKAGFIEIAFRQGWQRSLTVTVGLEND